MTFYSFVRCKPITSVRQLGAMSRHARRHDRSVVRPGAEPGAGLDFAGPSSADVRDYGALWRSSIALRGLALRKGAAIAAHLLVGVSPGWVAEAGDLHDPCNPRNVALLEAVVAWGEAWGGTGAVVAARLDLDEEGGAVVDLLLAPAREERHRSGVVRTVASLNKALAELTTATDETLSYGALQTSWAEFVQARLDPALERGERKLVTGRRHLPVAAFKQACDLLAAKRDAISRAQEEADAARAQAAEQVRAAQDRADALARREEALARREDALRQRARLLLARERGAQTGIAHLEKLDVRDGVLVGPAHLARELAPARELLIPIVSASKRRHACLDALEARLERVLTAAEYADLQASINTMRP
ncbi:MAG: hypothetical protein ACFE0R_05785 [Salinarimonas sp.]